MIILWSYYDHHMIIWWHWHIARIMSSHKIYGLCGLKHHIVEIRDHVTRRDGTNNKQTREDRATQPMDAGGWVSQFMATKFYLKCFLTLFTCRILLTLPGGDRGGGRGTARDLTRWDRRTSMLLLTDNLLLISFHYAQLTFTISRVLPWKNFIHVRSTWIWQVSMFEHYALCHACEFPSM